nr:MAG TPA: hypothetical protein [Caudoviricetes sp.]
MFCDVQNQASFIENVPDFVDFCGFLFRMGYGRNITRP